MKTLFVLRCFHGSSMKRSYGKRMYKNSAFMSKCYQAEWLSSFVTFSSTPIFYGADMLCMGVKYLLYLGLKDHVLRKE